MNSKSFEFKRSRGVVWVCDVENSSKYLNNDETANLIEEYLPRLHWVGRSIATSAGGEFIKWTGDGFLVWFDCELHRERGNLAKKAFETAWYLTLLSNVTCLGIDSDKNIKLRHGITFEEDALITYINENSSKSIDLLGRSVVLAFRLSGIPVQFPGIVTQKDLVTEGLKYNSFVKQFEKLIFTEDEINKYFKGEKWNTKSIYATSLISKRKINLNTVIKNAKSSIKEIESSNLLTPDEVQRIDYFKDLENGPEWVKAMLNKFLIYIKDDLYKVLKDRVNKAEELSTYI